MKLAFTLIAALVWQTGGLIPSADAPTQQAVPQHMRYERPLTVSSNASGIACAVLDANVYTHTASSSADDLRVFQTTGRTQQEVPFVVSYNEAQPTDAHTAIVHNLSLRSGSLVFDLAMPHRAYTLVDLHLAAQNFLATAEVSGSNNDGTLSKPLGTFVLFDLTQQHLARSTSLALQESDFAQLHIKLHPIALNGGPLPHLRTTIMQGATIPASREAQTLYTVVATTSAIAQQGSSSVAQMLIPAHVPIERISIVLDPRYKADFLRTVSIVAHSDDKASAQPQETIDDQIWRVTRKPDALSSVAIDAAKLNLTAVIASNLQSPASLRVEVKNDGQPPLPIRAVQLEMRQRTLCFNATPNATYTLRYGDDALRASVYDLSSLSELPATPLMATLGPERINPQYTQRQTATTYEDRNPDLIWVALLAAIALLGALVSRHTKRQGRHRERI